MTIYWSLNQLNMFRAILCLSSGAQDCEGCCSSSILHTEHIILAATLRASDRQQSRAIIPHTVNHSLALLRMVKELPEICWDDMKINNFLLLHLVGSSALFILIRHCQTHTKVTFVFVPHFIQTFNNKFRQNPSFLIRIMEVRVSNLAPRQFGFFSWILPTLKASIDERTSDWTRIASFYIPSNWSLTNQHKSKLCNLMH